MERHAQQCLHCGKDLANAQSLRRMTAGLARVKAPLNFEALVSDKIAAHKMRGTFSLMHSFGIFGFEWLSWRKMALAASSLAILGFGIFYAAHRQTFSPEPGLSAAKPQSADPVQTLIPETPPSASPAPSLVAEKPQSIAVQKKEDPPGTLSASAPEPPVVSEAASVAEAKQYPPPIDFDALESQGAIQAESVDYLLLGPDSHPALDRLPKKLYMPYGQASEEYFIRNVSH